MPLTQVTDPDVLSQLNAAPALKPVSDPALLAQLNSSETKESPGLLQSAQNYIVSGAQGLADAVSKWGHSVSINPITNAESTVEGALNIGTSMLSAPIALAEGPFRDKSTEELRKEITYVPRTEGGKAIPQVAGAVFKPVTDIFSGISSGVSGVTGIPTDTVQAGADTLMLGSVAKGGIKAGIKSVSKDVAPEVAAKDFIENKAGMKWDELPQTTKDKVLRVAHDPEVLNLIDPKALARQARADALNLPISRGQVTRDLSQLTQEENLTKSDAGKPIRDINAAQDTRLHELIDTLRTDTGATATTRQGVGESVQGAERAKADYLWSQKNAAYKAAKESGAMQTVVDTAPLQEWLKNPTNRRNASYLENALKDYAKEDGAITVNDLEEVRKEASANAKVPGPGQHFAGEAKAVIDEILDGVDVYKDARKANRDWHDEFDRQGRIKKLMTEKGYSSDRAVALEDTFDHVIKSPAEDIQKIKQSLVTGGDEATRARGSQAWKDIQGATIDYLKEKAAGKRAIVGENEQLQFNSTFREAFSELDKDGKINVIFNPKQAQLLRQIYDAAGDVRTKPTGRIAGSDTASRVVSMLDKVGKIPVVGEFVSGTIKYGKKIYDAGAEGRRADNAVQTPIDDAIKRAEHSRQKEPNRINGLVPLTAIEQSQQN